MQEQTIPYGKISSTADIGQLIRMRRKADGLTQADTAALCGVGTRFLSELERGKPTANIGKVLAILQGLGLEVHIRTKGVSR